MVHQNDVGPGAVTPQRLLELFEKGTLPWPPLDDREIDSRAQGDGVVKIIALSQLIYCSPLRLLAESSISLR